ncbi:hypothetical protein ABVT39_002975 [Epinephelus coioides]
MVKEELLQNRQIKEVPWVKVQGNIFALKPHHLLDAASHLTHQEAAQVPNVPQHLYGKVDRYGHHGTGGNQVADLQDVGITLPKLPEGGNDLQGAAAVGLLDCLVQEAQDEEWIHPEDSKRCEFGRKTAIQTWVLQPEIQLRQAAGDSAQRENITSCDVRYFLAEAILKCRHAFWAAVWQWFNAYFTNIRPLYLKRQEKAEGDQGCFFLGTTGLPLANARQRPKEDKVKAIIAKERWETNVPSFRDVLQAWVSPLKTAIEDNQDVIKSVVEQKWKNFGEPKGKGEERQKSTTFL